ncbi:hypothetical protein ES703_11693 [subsurface metagenome]
MKFWKLVGRSLAFYWRTHTAVLLGVMISTTILVGALTIGDSVRYSLMQLTFKRLGKTEYALVSEDRFFRSRLGDDLSLFLATEVAPALRFRGVAVSDGGLLRVNHVQVLGVDRRFWSIGNVSPTTYTSGMDEAVINQKLASKLKLKEGDEFLLRVQKVDSIPGDMPFSSGSESSIPLRLKAKAIVSDKEIGNFTLRANQAAPLNVFLSLSWLGKQMDLEHRANMLLVAEKQKEPLTLEVVHSALKNHWQLSDAGLELHELTELNMIELRSNRIFLDQPVVDAAFNTSVSAKGILTYFVNEFRFNNRPTPYSFVAAPGEPLVPSDMKDVEIIINEWLAEDLDAAPGDRIELVYYVLGLMRNLEERSALFTVRSVVPIIGSAAEKNLIPEFPGLAEVENCRDWNPGIPIDLGKIRKKDEQYWNLYRGTPKAFITLTAARKMWSNRFGSLTAVRYTGNRRIQRRVAAQIMDILEPSSLGFIFLPVRQDGIRAGMGAVDFGQLFLGLSFFIIIASLILTAMLFIFGIEQRSEETGTLLALGFLPSLIRRLFLAEGCIIAFVGSVLGTAMGFLYNQAILHGLGTFWKVAAGTSALSLHIRAISILIGVVSGIGMSIIAMWLATRKHRSRPLIQLLKSGGQPDVTHKFLISVIIASVCGIGILIIFSAAESFQEIKSTWSFFGAGTMMLVGSLALFDMVLLKLGRSKGKNTMTLAGLGFRNFVRRPGRSLAVTGILACGIFIVISVSANRSDFSTESDRRESGTGGFAYFGETTIPILHDLNSAEGRQNYGLKEIESADVQFVQIRVREGDDASCLNLNRIEKPRILGVRPEELAKRGSFSFVKTLDKTGDESPWFLLDKSFEDGTVPAVADHNVLVWGLHKSIGDTIAYTDEKGQRFELKLVGSLKNSIFQGNVLISEKAFLERFPSISGSQIILIDDIPAEKIEQVYRALLKAFRDFGLELTPAALRLAEFNRVENTYLSIYLLLGGLGLILGSFGMGIVVMRNVLERRSELAILRALGFGLSSIRRILLVEHLLMVGAGVGFGLAASIIAVLPSLLAPGVDLPVSFVAVILAVIVVCGWGWTYFATVFATKGNLIPALRNE